MQCRKTEIMCICSPILNTLYQRIVHTLSLKRINLTKRS